MMKVQLVRGAPEHDGAQMWRAAGCMCKCNRWPQPTMFEMVLKEYCAGLKAASPYLLNAVAAQARSGAQPELTYPGAWHQGCCGPGHKRRDFSSFPPPVAANSRSVGVPPCLPWLSSLWMQILTNSSGDWLTASRDS